MDSTENIIVPIYTTATELLEEVQKLLSDNSSWAKGAFARDKDNNLRWGIEPDATKWSVAGAVYKVYLNSVSRGIVHTHACLYLEAAALKVGFHSLGEACANGSIAKQKEILKLAIEFSKRNFLTWQAWATRTVH